MFTNDSILHIAMQQSAIEYNCAIDAFMQQQSVITLPCASTSARKYLDVPFRCSLVSYGKNVVACAEKVLHNELRQYLDGHKFYRCLTGPAVFELNEILASAGLKVGYMSEYFLPDVSKMQAFLPVDDKFELRRLGQADFASLYLPQWSHALCSERKELDILGMAVVVKAAEAERTPVGAWARFAGGSRNCIGVHGELHAAAFLLEAVVVGQAVVAAVDEQELAGHEQRGNVLIRLRRAAVGDEILIN